MPTLTSVTKHFITAQEGFTTTTAGSVASGAATVTLNSVSGYTNGDQVAFVIDPTDVTKKQVFTGTIDTSGVQVTNVVWTEGTNQTHAAGATVVDYTTATHQAAMVKGVKVSLDQDGTLKAGAVDNSAVIADGVVSTAKIADSAVTPIKQSNPYMFSVYRNAAGTSSSSLTIINFDTVQYDPNSDFDLSTEKYTAPVSGYYSLSAAAGNSTAINLQNVVAIYRNTTNVANAAFRIDGTNPGTVIAVSKLVYLAAGDTAEVRFLGGAGSAFLVGEHNLYFTGFLVRQTA